MTPTPCGISKPRFLGVLLRSVTINIYRGGVSTMTLAGMSPKLCGLIATDSRQRKSNPTDPASFISGQREVFIYSLDFDFHKLDFVLFASLESRVPSCTNEDLQASLELNEVRFSSRIKLSQYYRLIQVKSDLPIGTGRTKLKKVPQLNERDNC